MGRYVIHRLLLIIPTIFFVISLAFIFTKMIPGDTADGFLLLQGIHHESSNYKTEYQKVYTRLNLDKPLFYFTIRPDFFPANIHSITDPSVRSQIKDLLYQKRSYADINHFIDARYAFLKNIQLDPIYKDRKWNDLLKNMVFTTDLNELGFIFDSLSTSEVMRQIGGFETAIKSFAKLKADKISFFYPKCAWHGINNQFHLWVINVIHGNFGESSKDGRPVMTKITSAIQWTLLLIMLNLIITNAIALPSGILSGYYNGGWYDKISNFIWTLLFTIPVFWLASMMIIYFTSDKFGQWMHIFPAPGNWFIPEGQSFFRSFIQYSGQLALPVICLVANDIAQVSRILRNNVIQQKHMLYVRFAQSKGLSGFKTMMHHILPNVLIPIVTIIGGRIPAGLSGALVIEVIFNIPGMGRLMMDSINSYDWNVVFGILIVISFFTMCFMLVTDIVYQWVNPRIKNSFQT